MQLFPVFLPGSDSSKIPKTRSHRRRAGTVCGRCTLQRQSRRKMPPVSFKELHASPPAVSCPFSLQPSLLTLPEAFLLRILLTSRESGPLAFPFPVPLKLHSPVPYFLPPDIRHHTHLFLLWGRPTCGRYHTVLLSPFHGPGDRRKTWSGDLPAVRQLTAASEQNSHPEPATPHPRLFLLLHATCVTVRDPPWKEALLWIPSFVQEGASDLNILISPAGKDQLCNFHFIRIVYRGCCFDD